MWPDREASRALVPENRFLEVYVRCDLEVCRQRDPKGLYARAERGEIGNFTGVSAPYEEPPEPELVLESDRRTVEMLAQQVLDDLVARRIVRNISAPPASATGP